MFACQHLRVYMWYTSVRVLSLPGEAAHWYGAVVDYGQGECMAQSTGEAPRQSSCSPNGVHDAEAIRRA